MSEYEGPPESTARNEIFEAAWASISAQEAFWRAFLNSENYPSDEGLQTLGALGRYFTDRGRALLTLGVRGFDWDADIVLRVMYECAAKIFLLSSVDDEERALLVTEFWHLVPASSDRKTARKAALAQVVFPDDHPSRDVFALIQDSRMARASQILSKPERRRIESRWSFSAIVDRLAESLIGEEIRSLLHMYGMQSHLVHVDHAAIDLMYDRALRPTEELAVLQLSHAARIASDASSLGYFAAYLAAPLAGLSNEDTSATAECNTRMLALASAHGNSFDESQRQFYDRMLRRKTADK